MSGNILFGTSERKNLRAAELMLSRALSGVSEGEHEHMGLADSFDPFPAGLEGDVEQTFPVIEVRRLGDVETGIRIFGHALPSTNATSERDVGALSKVNGSLIDVVVAGVPLCARTTDPARGRKSSGPRLPSASR